MSTVPLGSYNNKSFVSGSYGRERTRMMRKEAEFVSGVTSTCWSSGLNDADLPTLSQCKDFMCCGKDLGSLHDLLEHVSEIHYPLFRDLSPDRG